MSVWVWRIGTDAPTYTADDLSGEGARQSGGRWNRVGTPMVYASSSIALACLETLAHLGTFDLPLNRYLVRIDVPEAVWDAATAFKPEDHVGWDAIPTGKVSLDVGEQWAAGLAAALLIVPSAIVPEECNVLINPAHPEVAHLSARKLRRWTYDPRLR